MRKGFTFIGLMLVICIVTIIAAITYHSYYQIKMEYVAKKKPKPFLEGDQVHVVTDSQNGTVLGYKMVKKSDKYQWKYIIHVKTPAGWVEKEYWADELATPKPIEVDNLQ